MLSIYELLTISILFPFTFLVPPPSTPTQIIIKRYAYIFSHVSTKLTFPFPISYSSSFFLVKIIALLLSRLIFCPSMYLIYLSPDVRSFLKSVCCFCYQSLERNLMDRLQFPAAHRDVVPHCSKTNHFNCAVVQSRLLQV